MRRRSPYYRVQIGNINRSELIKDEEDRWRLLAPNGKYLFRVWIMGIVTAKYSGENNYTGLIVEDGTGAIFVKSWVGALDHYNRWNKIEVLGQIQISEQGEDIDVFITPDIIQEILDDNWVLFHRLKIVQTLKSSSMNLEIKKASVGGVDLGIVSIEDLKKRLKEMVIALDKGNGVTLDQFTRALPKVDEAQIFDAITELLESGEFFEPKVGTYSSAYDS